MATQTSNTEPGEKPKDAETGHTNPLTGYDIGTLGKVNDVVTRDFLGASISDAYRLKSELVSKALSEIGMGRYQWELFIVTGLGWITNNLMTQGLSTTLTPISLEFNVEKVSYATVAYYAGMAIGASFWGINSDIIGRLPSFNITLFITGIACTAVGGSPNFATFCALWVVVGIGTGGNVPVDALMFLESLPASHQWLLTVLSAWWCGGQVIASLIAWVFLANFSCAADALGGCRKEDNMGWRYTLIALGLLTVSFAATRIFVFKIPESPWYLLSVGRDEDAIATLNFIAKRNGKPEPLTLADLKAVDHELGVQVGLVEERPSLSILGRIKEAISEYKGEHIKALFSSRKLGLHCIIVWTIWATIGIAYPLYFNFIPSYLAAKFTTTSSLDRTYTNYCIVSAAGVTGPIAAGLLIETRFGRKWIMAVSFVVAGVFLFLYTTARNEAADLGFQCATAVLGNFSYAILYAYTPESLPAPHRGTGNGIASFLMGFCGMIAPIISANTGFTMVPIYASAGLWCFGGIMTCLLSFETHNHAAM